MYIQELIARLEAIRLEHGNLKVEVSDGDYIAPATDLGTPTDVENGGRTLVINGQFAHMFNEYESALHDIIEATAAYHQYDTAGRPWLKAALELIGESHPDTDLHRAGCAHCQYVHDSKL